MTLAHYGDNYSDKYVYFDQHICILLLISVLKVSLVRTMYETVERNADDGLAFQVCVSAEGEIQLPTMMPGPFATIRGVPVVLKTRDGTAMCTYIALLKIFICSLVVSSYDTVLVGNCMFCVVQYVCICVHVCIDYAIIMRSRYLYYLYCKHFTCNFMNFHSS